MKEVWGRLESPTADFCPSEKTDLFLLFLSPRIFIVLRGGGGVMNSIIGISINQYIIVSFDRRVADPETGCFDGAVTFMAAPSPA